MPKDSTGKFVNQPREFWMKARMKRLNKDNLMG